MIGWTVIISNAVLLILIPLMPFLRKIPIVGQIVSWFSIVAVFPASFFYGYMADKWLAQILWVLMMIVFSIGILQFSQLARKIFIIFNIVHIVVLSFITFARSGTNEFLDYFFLWYFNLVASGAYVGFITTTEVRQQFGKFRNWDAFIKKIRFKTADKAAANSYNNLGVTYGRLGRYDDAVLALQKAIRLNPQHAEYHFQLGMIFVQKKEYGNAIAAFKEAIRLDPNQAKSVYQLGLAYKKEGCDREAIVILEEAIQLQPGQADGHDDLGRAYMSTGRWSDAIKSFEKSVSVNFNNHVAFYQMGVCYAQLEQYKEAREILRKSIRLNTDLADTHFQMGVVCLKLMSYKEAIREFKEVLRLDPDNRQAHYQLGFAYTLIKDFDSARREHKLLKNLDSDLADNLWLLLR